MEETKREKSLIVVVTLAARAVDRLAVATRHFVADALIGSCAKRIVVCDAREIGKIGHEAFDKVAVAGCHTRGRFDIGKITADHILRIDEGYDVVRHEEEKLLAFIE